MSDVEKKDGKAITLVLSLDDLERIALVGKEVGLKRVPLIRFALTKFLNEHEAAKKS